VSSVADKTDLVFGPWNPGVESQVPGHLRHLATIFRPENVFTNFATAEELRDLTGLELTELVAFRPQRLALHELLIRVTADIAVPDGSAIGDLGINFRQIVSDIHSKHIEPQMTAITSHYDEVRRQVATKVDAELGAFLSGPPTRTPAPKRAKSWLFELFSRGPATTPVDEASSIPEQSVVARWEAQAHVEGDELHVELRERHRSRRPDLHAVRERRSLDHRAAVRALPDAVLAALEREGGRP